MKKINFLSTLMLVLIFSCGFSTSQNHAETQDVNEDPTRPRILISTPMGEMTIELFNETPLHRDNFLKLAESGYYDSTLFHRVIMDFMIQGGDPASRNAIAGEQLGSGGPGYTLPAEFSTELIHHKGALSAARMGDHVNPARESSGSQFYIVQGKVFTPQELDMLEQRMEIVFSDQQRTAYTTVGGTPHLDGAYTVFGQLVDGFDVLDQIAATQTDRANRPIADIPITMTILK